MCATCGCDERHEGEGRHVHRRADGTVYEHEHALAPPRRVRIEQDLLAKNDGLAAQNRASFSARGLAAFNLTSSPGSGKTTLLEALIARVGARVPLAVIEGDQDTERDAERIRAAGAPVVQINTGTGCHLDAGMVADAVARLAPPDGTLLLIENVGNLVCPALFDLGERAKIVLMSVTEGEDKPLKYPHMFRAAEVLVLTKIDLLPHLTFDVERCLANARRINPALRVFRVSATTGGGELADLCAWMAAQATAPLAKAHA